MKILKRKTLAALLALSLLASILPLGAQPALAAENAPTTLYVGNYQITNSGTTTYLKASSTEGSLTEGSETDWNVKYDPSTATLTLNGATIKGGTSTGSAPFGSGIYALSSSNQPVTLTIELIGENTITGTFGIYVNANQGTTDASLVIKKSDDNGSLTVTGTGNSGLLIISGTGDASLTIKNVSVVANATSSYSGSGVCVQSGASATDSPNISLSVDGGSLTASGTGSRDGILFYVGQSQATGATTSLTVSENAIVDARNGGIKATRILETLPTPTPTGNNSSGIVFNGKNGTVYGNVTLQEDLEIGEGESLTIGKDASLNTGSHEVIVDGGTLTGRERITGTVKYAPTITTQPTSQTVTEGETATFTVEATGTEPLSYQWQQSTDKGSSWTNIDSATNTTYTTGKTTMDMNGTQYRCVVSNSAGSVTSDAATLTVSEPAPITYTINADVTPSGAGTATANKTTAAEGDTVTLTATANPGYRFTSWTSVGGGTFANSSSVNTTFTMPSGDVTVTANFVQVYTVTVSSTAGGTATADKTTAAAGETVTLTATPNSGYHFAGWNVVSGTVTIQDKQFIMPANDVDIQAIFARNTSPTIPPTVSEKTTDAIKAADPGETVTVDLSHGSTKLDKEVFETLAGQDITLDIDLGDGLSWTVNGTDIPEDADFVDIDMGVTMDSDGIPVDLINAITGEHGSVQMTLAHDGAFGFTMTLTAPLGEENAGYWANLYYFDEDANAMTFETAAPIGSDGSVSLSLSHASQYAIVIDNHNHGIVTLPFTDVSDSDWFYDPACFVYSQGLMTGTSENTFEPNTPLSRAMLVAVLHRLEGSPAASAGDFTDVAEGDWYAQAVNWAASVGVVNGFDDGTFQPNAAITREQLAAILMNYAQYKGQDVSARATLDTYNDATAISSWANDVMSWAVAEGLLTGVTNDQLQPQGNATRAQVAAILERFLAE